MITVRELLSDKSFSGFIVLAGDAGLDKRQINTLCVIDTPDLSGWVLGNEFFISSGYIFKDDPAKLLSIIETAAKNGAAALGIKTGRFTGRLPREVINLANKLEFPLIDIPNHYNHTEIINPALTKIISKQAAMLDFSEKVRGVFFDIVLRDSSLKDILDKLSDFLACDVGFVDISSGERYASGLRDFAEVFGNLPLPKLLELYDCESVHTGNKRYGYIISKSENRGAPVLDDNVPMTHAKTTLLIQLQKESAKREVEKRYVNEFVQDIFLRRFRNTREILDRGRNFKWNLEVPQVALAFEVADKPGGNPIGQKVFYQCVSLLACHYRSIPNTEMRGQLICLLPIKGTWAAEKSMLAKLISEIQANISQTFSL
ncbi:MAG: PucR family transcriptional regulator ligand-binding domain-containing protein, partial [Synergistaceae bacterium]